MTAGIYFQFKGKTIREFHFDGDHVTITLGDGSRIIVAGGEDLSIVNEDWEEIIPYPYVLQ